jgi:hypothetical protein
MERSHIYNGRNNSRFGKQLPYSIQRGYVNSQQVSHFGNVINKDSSLRPTLRQNPLEQGFEIILEALK